jgi:hypothetical protein
MTVDRGREQHGITEMQMRTNAALGLRTVGLTEGADPHSLALPLDTSALAALVLRAGVPLERLDPNQLIAAQRYIAGARERGSQAERITNAIDAFKVLDTIGAPELTRRQAASVVARTCRGLSNAHLDAILLDRHTRAEFVQRIAAAANAGTGATTVEVGGCEFHVRVDDQGNVMLSGGKSGFFRKLGRTLRKLAHRAKGSPLS